MVKIPEEQRVTSSCSKLNGKRLGIALITTSVGLLKSAKSSPHSRARVTGAKIKPINLEYFDGKCVVNVGDDIVVSKDDDKKADF